MPLAVRNSPISDSQPGPLGESRHRPRGRPAEQADELTPPEHAARPPRQRSRHSSRRGNAKGGNGLGPRSSWDDLVFLVRPSAGLQLRPEYIHVE